MKTTRKKIKDFPFYEVSSNGEIFSMKRKNDLKLMPCDNGNGYKQCHLLDKSKRTVKYIHRLVAEEFIPNPYNKKTVNHKDGDKANNHISNLEWATQKENNNHAIEIGLNPTKEKRIKRISKNGSDVFYKSGKEAARANNIHPKCVSDAALGRQKTAGGFRWEYAN